MVCSKYELTNNKYIVSKSIDLINYLAYLQVLLQVKLNIRSN